MRINLTRLQDILDEVHDISLFDALQLLQEQEDDGYDPEGERERIEMLEEREMESHIAHIRSQGGDYWKNEDGEWMCG
jgi:hypothetical protein